MVSRAFVIHPADNVATLLGDAEAGTIELIGATEHSDRPLVALGGIQLGHKVALSDIAAGEAVVKYGLPIGHATQLIPRGAWVHLHNCASDYDERSATLDVQSGAPTDTRYE